MDKIKKGLGRGLSSLIGETKVESQKNQISISDLVPNKYQPRKIFEESNLEELTNSIKERGMIQPIIVRKSNGDKSKFEIIAGERRWLAAQKAGLHKVPIIIHDLNDSEVLEVAIDENIQREDLNAIEEAQAYKRLNKEFNYDQEKIATLMGKSRSHISNTLRLLNLPKDIILMISEGEITAGQARPLVGLPNASQIAEEIVSKKLSARSIENIKKRKSRSFTIDPNIFDAQREIERKLGLKVLITNKRNNSGKISVEYKNIDQFEMISNLLKKG